MEEIALMALPRNAEDDSEEGSMSSNHTSQGKLTHDHSSSIDGRVSNPARIRQDDQKWLQEDAVEEEDFIIKCVCGYTGDDGNIVLCDRCETWQHIECYYHGEPGLNMNGPHFCIDCEPRPLDAKGATERQEARQAALGLEMV